MPTFPRPFPLSRHAQTLADRRERRYARALWRRGVLARVVSGEPRPSIADDLQVSLSTVKRAVARALEELPPDEVEVFSGLQFERLSKALRLADRRIEDGDLRGVHALARVATMLDRYRDRRTTRNDGRSAGVAHHLSGNIKELLMQRLARLPEPARESDPPDRECEPLGPEK